MPNDMLNAVAGSGLSGAATGFTATGGNPIGAAIGGVIGVLGGIAQGKEAKRLQKAYDQAEAAVNPVDPALVNHLSRLRQMERNFRAGTDPSSAFAAQQARGVGAQTQSNLLRAGGPNAVGQLLRAQAGTNNAMANIGAQAAAGADRMLQMQGGLIGSISDRVYQRQRELRNQALARVEQRRQDINNTLTGALGMIPQMAGQFKIGKAGGGAAPFTPTPGAYNPGGMVGSTYIPGVNTGVSYGGLGTGLPENQINFGLR